MSESPLLSARVPADLYRRIIDHAAQHDPGPGGRTRIVVAALTAYMAPKPERIPSHKVKRTLKPLSEHTKARMAVYRWLREPGTMLTSSELAHWTGQTTNNAAKRCQELAAEGYIQASGQYRKSRDSGKMLTLWARTDKPIP
jgi:hypothetical protein